MLWLNAFQTLVVCELSEDPMQILIQEVWAGPGICISSQLLPHVHGPHLTNRDVVHSTADHDTRKREAENDI